jgi:hypothetical protein
MSRDSSVSKVTGRWLDYQEFNSRQWQEIFSFPRAKQPEREQHQLLLISIMCGALLSLLRLHGVVLGHRETFTFHLYAIFIYSARPAIYFKYYLSNFVLKYKD